MKVNTVAPDFRTLLFPYREGEEQPKTRWNADKTKLSIEWSDQKDSFEFYKPADGRTRVRLTRDGAKMMEME